MKIKYIHIILTILILLGISFIVQIIWVEFTIGNICPDFLLFPACYIVLLNLILLFILHIFSKELWFLLVNGFGIVLVGFASFKHYIGEIQCYIIEHGIVSCYIFLLLFLIFLLLKAVQLKIKYT